MRNIFLVAAVGAALALAPGIAAASGHHAMMKKAIHQAKAPKGEPMQSAGSVGESAATNGKTSNTGGGK